MSNRNYDIDEPKKQGNVKIERKASKSGYAIVAVWLYNTKVFEADLGRRVLKFNTGGWYTASTRDVINRALSQFRPDMKIFKAKNIWRVSFANGQEESHLEACENKFYGF